MNKDFRKMGLQKIMIIESFSYYSKTLIKAIFFIY